MDFGFLNLTNKLILDPQVDSRFLCVWICMRILWIYNGSSCRSYQCHQYLLWMRNAQGPLYYPTNNTYQYSQCSKLLTRHWHIETFIYSILEKVHIVKPDMTATQEEN